MQEMDDLNEEGKTLLYPRLVAKGRCDMKQLAQTATYNTTINPSELKAAVELLRNGMTQLLAEGHTVHIDGMGTFSLSIALRKGRERERTDGSGTRRNASSICVSGVNFRPDKQWLAELDTACRPTRAPQTFARKRSPYTPEERLALALKHLAGHPWLDTGTYALLTGLSRTTAGRELRRLATDPLSGLQATGSRTHRIYVRRAADAEGETV